MKHFAGKTLRWDWRDGIVELTLDHAPANEIGTATLADLEKFAGAISALQAETAVCIISSARKEGLPRGTHPATMVGGRGASVRKRTSRRRSPIPGAHPC